MKIKEIIKLVKKERWVLHVVVMMPIAYLLASFVTHTLGGDLSALATGLVLFIPGLVTGFLWETYHKNKSNAVFSESDILFTGLGGFLGGWSYGLTPNFNVGYLFLYIATGVVLYFLGRFLYQIFIQGEDTWEEIKPKVLIFFLVLILYSVVAFIHGI